MRGGGQERTVLRRHKGGSRARWRLDEIGGAIASAVFDYTISASQESKDSH